MRIKSKSIAEWLALYSFAIYTITLYIFANNKERLIYSEVGFLLFVAFSFIYIITKKRLYIHRFIVMLAIFVLYCGLSLTWAIDLNLAATRFLTLVQLFVLSTLIYQVFYISKRIEFLISCLLVAGIVLCIYCFIIYTPSEIINMLVSGERFGNKIADVNIVGTNLSITIILGFYYALAKKKRLLFIVIIIAFVLLIATGSKIAIIMLIAGIVALLYFRVGEKSKIKFIVLFFGFIVVCFILSKQGWLSSVFSRFIQMLEFMLNGDMSDASTYYRWEFIRSGVSFFIEQPILGYGIGVSNTLIGTYFHNNFVQLLVEVGLIGFLSFYSMYIYIIKGLFKLIKIKKEAVPLIISIIAMLVSDISVSTYYYKQTYVILAMAFIYLRIAEDNSRYKFEMVESNQHIKKI